MAYKKELKFMKEESRFLEVIADYRDNPEQVNSFITENYNQFFKDIPDGEHKIRLLKKIYQNSLRDDPDRGNHIINITDKDIDFLRKLPNELIKRLFYALIVRAQVKPHETGWIALDFENTLRYAFSDKEARNSKIEIFSECTPHGFETLVIGSANPVLCFKLPIEHSENVLITFKDGEAREKFFEVINFDRHTN